MDIERIISIINEMLEQSGITDVSLRKDTTVQRNGHGTGIRFIRDGHKTIPVFAIPEDLPEDDFAEYAEAVVRTYLKREYMAPEFDVAALQDKEYVLQHVFPTLVKSSWNKDLLAQCPHKEFLDLSILYRLYVPAGNRFEDQNHEASTLFGYNFLSQFPDLSVEQVHAAALENLRKEGLVIKSVVKLLTETTGATLEELGFDDQEHPMYIVKAGESMHGAAGILLPDLMKKVVRVVGTKQVILLPSSSAEFLAVPDYAADAGISFQDLIQGINAGSLSKEEWLSDHAYLYDSDDGSFSVME